jgi:hypothetical protein
VTQYSQTLDVSKPKGLLQMQLSSLAVLIIPGLQRMFLCVRLQQNLISDIRSNGDSGLAALGTGNPRFIPLSLVCVDGIPPRASEEAQEALKPFLCALVSCLDLALALQHCCFQGGIEAMPQVLQVRGNPFQLSCRSSLPLTSMTLANAKQKASYRSARPSAARAKALARHQQSIGSL